ncbi:MAG: hypothetical protein Kow0031_02670 [Anaerolineae bacterium]
MLQNQNQIPHELRLYTTAEVAAILGVSLRTVQSWIKEGSLPHIRLGEGQKLVRVQGKDVDDLIRSGRRQ